MTIHTRNYETLVLNADFQPLSLYPLSKWEWTDAVKALTLGRVVLVAEYDEFIQHPLHKMRFPSIIAVKEYQRKTQSIAFSRYNIWLRDGGQCMYCPAKVSTRDLTYDHVHPRSLGGPATWENIVCACEPCNRKKANKTCEQAKMYPRVAPRKPKAVELAIKKQMLDQGEDLHQSWIDYLYWDGELLAR